MNGRDLFAVGQIEKAFGIRGEVIVRSMTDDPGRFRTLTHAFLGRSAESVRDVEIVAVQVGTRGIRVSISGVEDRTTAEKLVGSFLFVDSADRIDLPPGRHFVHELIGLTVLDQDGCRCGSIVEVLKMPAHDVYVVKDQEDQFMIPAVKEFILGIDTKSRILRVRLIEGMRGE